ncbi:MAG TPA: flavodoxin family protein [Anaerolineae bacterium]|nr:flavodoxin family protein [Anaerolineae bacterium]HQJ51281.1 flavodoxin family protein [Anaerolineae bacterium]
MAGHKVLGIVGSPRRNGNTAILVETVLEAARARGASTEKVFLADLDIAPCDACRACVESGECVHRDAMDELFPQMFASDVWVLGTPVYWWGASAQFKAFLDRWYSLSQRSEDKARFRGRKLILVAPMGDDTPETARHVVGMMADVARYLEAELFATVLAPGASDRGDVLQMPSVLEAARRAGQEAVS